MAFKIISTDDSPGAQAAREKTTAEYRRKEAFEYLEAPKVAEGLDSVKRQIGIVLTTLHDLELTADEALELLANAIDLRWHHNRTPPPRALDVYLKQYRTPPDQSTETRKRTMRKALQHEREIEALPKDARDAFFRDDACAQRIINRIVRTRYEALPPDWDPFGPEDPPPNR